jgi:predicted RNA binding protein YcfA (HicA-like mRNA interferase family)
MPINYDQLRTLTARELINALTRDGFHLRNQRGSHQRYRHPDGRRVTVSFHRPSDTFPPPKVEPYIPPGIVREKEKELSAKDKERQAFNFLRDCWFSC